MDRSVRRLAVARQRHPRLNRPGPLRRWAFLPDTRLSRGSPCPLKRQDRREPGGTKRGDKNSRLTCVKRLFEPVRVQLCRARGKSFKVIC